MMQAAVAGQSTAARATDLPATQEQRATAQAQTSFEASPLPDLLTAELSDFAVSTSTALVAVGDGSVDVANVSPGYHNLVIIRTDLPPDALPTDEDGAVDELAGGLDVVDEVSELPPDEADSIVTQLEPGAYALVCNVVDDSGVHYQLGMSASLRVR